MIRTRTQRSKRTESRPKTCNARPHVEVGRTLNQHSPTAMRTKIRFLGSPLEQAEVDPERTARVAGYELPLLGVNLLGPFYFSQGTLGARFVEKSWPRKTAKWA